MRRRADFVGRPGRFVRVVVAFVGPWLTCGEWWSSMAAMVKQLTFILGHVALVASAPRAQVSQRVVAAPTASARRSAAQPKSKTAKPRR
jgi:hypothetical protein